MNNKNITPEEKAHLKKIAEDLRVKVDAVEGTAKEEFMNAIHQAIDDMEKGVPEFKVGDNVKILPHTHSTTSQYVGRIAEILPRNSWTNSYVERVNIPHNEEGDLFIERKHLRHATPSEIEAAKKKQREQELIEEAKRLGFLPGAKVGKSFKESYYYGDFNCMIIGEGPKFNQESEDVLSVCSQDDYWIRIYQDGKWATIIDDLDQRKNEDRLDYVLRLINECNAAMGVSGPHAIILCGDVSGELVDYRNKRIKKFRDYPSLINNLKAYIKKHDK